MADVPGSSVGLEFLPSFSLRRAIQAMPASDSLTDFGCSRWLRSLVHVLFDRASEGETVRLCCEAVVRLLDGCGGPHECVVGVPALGLPLSHEPGGFLGSMAGWLCEALLAAGRFHCARSDIFATILEALRAVTVFPDVQLLRNCKAQYWQRGTRTPALSRGTSGTSTVDERPRKSRELPPLRGVKRALWMKAREAAHNTPLAEAAQRNPLPSIVPPAAADCLLEELVACGCVRLALVALKNFGDRPEGLRHTRAALSVLCAVLAERDSKSVEHEPTATSLPALRAPNFRTPLIASLGLQKSRRPELAHAQPSMPRLQRLRPQTPRTPKTTPRTPSTPATTPARSASEAVAFLAHLKKRPKSPTKSPDPKVSPAKCDRPQTISPGAWRAMPEYDREREGR